MTLSEAATLPLQPLAGPMFTDFSLILVIRSDGETLRISSNWSIHSINSIKKLYMDWIGLFEICICFPLRECWTKIYEYINSSCMYVYILSTSPHGSVPPSPSRQWTRKRSNHRTANERTGHRRTFEERRGGRRALLSLASWPSSSTHRAAGNEGQTEWRNSDAESINFCYKLRIPAQCPANLEIAQVMYLNPLQGELFT